MLPLRRGDAAVFQRCSHLLRLRRRFRRSPQAARHRKKASSRQSHDRPSAGYVVGGLPPLGGGFPVPWQRLARAVASRARTTRPARFIGTRCGASLRRVLKLGRTSVPRRLLMPDVTWVCGGECRIALSAACPPIFSGPQSQSARSQSARTWRLQAPGSYWRYRTENCRAVRWLRRYRQFLARSG